MKIKERVFRESIARAEKRIKKIKEILEAKPISEIISLREKAREIQITHKEDHKKILELIDPLAKKEKKLIALMKRQHRDYIKLSDEQFELMCELEELKHELFVIEAGKTMGAA
jgi:hypothetical protein